MYAANALELVLQSLPRGRHYPLTGLDVGAGDGKHAQVFIDAGVIMQTVDYQRDHILYENTPIRPDGYDLIWCSHTLEHMPDYQAVLRRFHVELKPQGLLAITVPPPKDETVGGHINLFTTGTLLVNLVLAGFDCSRAACKEYGYNQSVIVRESIAVLPHLAYDHGDITRLAPYLPPGCGREGFDGRPAEINWQPV